MKKVKCPKCKHKFEIKEEPSEETKLAKEILSAGASGNKKKQQELSKKAVELYGWNWKEFKKLKKKQKV